MRHVSEDVCGVTARHDCTTPPAHPCLVFIVRCFVTVQFPNLLFDEQKQKNRKLFFFLLSWWQIFTVQNCVFGCWMKTKGLFWSFFTFTGKKIWFLRPFQKHFAGGETKRWKCDSSNFWPTADKLRHRIDPRMKKQNRACSCRMFLCSYLINNDWFQPFPGFFPPLWPKRVWGERTVSVVLQATERFLQHQHLQCRIIWMFSCQVRLGGAWRVDVPTKLQLFSKTAPHLHPGECFHAVWLKI